MRLIHYSKEPLPTENTLPAYYDHNPERCGVYKTNGLWLSVLGEDDWPSWCIGEQFGLERLACATEIFLSKDAKVLWLKSAEDIDGFTEKYKTSLYEGGADNAIDWPRVREKWQGLIIAPYCWERRLERHTMWYYPWDCASGVIWDTKAIRAIKLLPGVTDGLPELIRNLKGEPEPQPPLPENLETITLQEYQKIMQEAIRNDFADMQRWFAQNQKTIFGENK